MTILADTLKAAESIHYLVELDFGGLIKRYSDFDIRIPNADGDDLLFEAAITKPISFGTRFDFRATKYAIGRVDVEIANAARLQDAEVDRALDGGAGRIYIWCDGLDFTDIEVDGLIFSGTFQKNWHTRQGYSFTLNESAWSKLGVLPGLTINDQTWPDFRDTSDGVAVGGRAVPLVFGSWSGKIPLLCVDTSGGAHRYLAALGPIKSTEADFNAGTQNLYVQAGTAVSPANYTVNKGLDGLGNPTTTFYFPSAVPAANEPLYVSMEGLVDGAGEITPDAGDLIEHPAHIAQYLLKNHSFLAKDEISEGDFKTMASLLPGLKFASIINEQVGGLDVLTRLLSQCQAALIPRPGGRLGAMTLDDDAPALKTLSRNTDMVGRTARISRTPMDMVVSDLAIEFGLNPTTAKYETMLYLDPTNSQLCKDSYLQYGARPRLTLKLPDVQEESTALACANRFLGQRAFRRDLVEVQVPIWEGIDVLEGDAASLTIPEGPSRDGSGWIDEKFILIERKFQGAIINQKWMRASVN